MLFILAFKSIVSPSTSGSSDSLEKSPVTLQTIQIVATEENQNALSQQYFTESQGNIIFTSELGNSEGSLSLTFAF